MPREHRSTTKRKFQQWKRSRKGLIDKIGKDVLPDTEKLKNKLDVAGIGIETDVAKGVLAYVDLAHFKAKQTQDYSSVAFNAAGNASIAPSIYQSKGTALIFGSQLSF